MIFNNIISIIKNGKLNGKQTYICKSCMRIGDVDGVVEMDETFNTLMIIKK